MAPGDGVVAVPAIGLCLWALWMLIRDPSETRIRFCSVCGHPVKWFSEAHGYNTRTGTPNVVRAYKCTNDACKTHFDW